ncbi:MAG: TIGR01212 family radical SAM protein [Lachnospiraceae bacterium]|nr:TIGR01212 family radical SAM protein [Lachnospiraceae bacterium]
MNADLIPAGSRPSAEFFENIWHGKRYYSLDAYCKNTFGEKLYKVSLNAGLTCPNRDGTLDTRGCIFCSPEGSGDFAARLSPGMDSEASFHHAYEESLRTLSAKSTGRRYIAYFQAFTNTYGPLSYLERIYRLALMEPSTAGISIATRPDALPREVPELLCRLREEFAPKFIWIELGLQTIHERTADFIRRYYPLSCFEDSVRRLHEADFPVITHIILGLPGETEMDILETISYLNRMPISGIKLQLLHILKGTDLGALYVKDPDRYCTINSPDSYLDLLITCLMHLRPDFVVHRVTGDARRSLLLAPSFSGNKRYLLNALHRKMRDEDVWQGRLFQTT